MKLYSKVSDVRDVTKTISFTSGKGGVGKTTIVSNLSHYLSQKDKKILIFDGDMGMSNVDIMFKVKAQNNIYDVIKGNCGINDILVNISDNISLVSGGSGIYELSQLNSYERKTIIDEISSLNQNFDFLIIDTAPGISDNVLTLNAASDMTVVIITPEPSSFTDSYALIKLLNQKFHKNKFSVICNHVTSHNTGILLFEKFYEVVDQFLDVGLNYLGEIVSDPYLRIATHSQRLIVKNSPGSFSSIGLKNIANNVLNESIGQSCIGGMEFFWKQLAVTA